MTTTTACRRAIRASVLALPVAVVLTGGAAYADTPAAWEEADNPPGIEMLLIFGGITLGIALLISVLAAAPSIMRGDRHQRDVKSWNDPEWFGSDGSQVRPPAHRAALSQGDRPGELGEGPDGPRGGVATRPATEAAEPGGSGEHASETGSDTGGASARW